MLPTSNSVSFIYKTIHVKINILMYIYFSIKTYISNIYYNRKFFQKKNKKIYGINVIPYLFHYNINE